MTSSEVLLFCYDNPMKQYNFYLLDWDGCLAQTLELWLKAYRDTYADYNVHPSDTEIASQFGNWNAPMVFGIESVDEYTEKLLERVQHKLRTVNLYPGAREFLEVLKKQRSKIALVSSSKRDDLEAAIAHNDLEHMFDFVLSADDVTEHKPNPEVIHKALNELQGVASQAVIVGDSKSDLGAAQNAKIDSILVFPKSHQVFYSLENLMTYNPTYVVASFSELTEKLS
jgi:pyrophosphatase PpaX